MIFKTNLTPVSAARFKHWREEDEYTLLHTVSHSHSVPFAPTPSTTQVSHDIQSALLGLVWFCSTPSYMSTT